MKNIEYICIKVQPSDIVFLKYVSTLKLELKTYVLVKMLTPVKFIAHLEKNKYSG